jgi:uncharacterized membrane protein
VEAISFPGEVTTVNNKKEAFIDVGRDRFRVLYICGEPGPEYGYLRHQFKSDPAVELVTFVILRNSSNVISVPESELSLIPFPTSDALVTQIPSFDLIVFEEFSYQQYGLPPQVLQAVKKKVKEGGSFLLTGGRQAFGMGSSYAIPEIAEMIPINFGSPEVKFHDGKLSISVKAPDHPIMRIEQNREQNKILWSNVPPLDSVSLVPSAKPGALVLASVNVNGIEHPLLTVWPFGKGRVAALAARTTWRWSLEGGIQNTATDVYRQFWKNMVLWLTHSNDFKQVRVGLESKAISTGQVVPLRVWAYDNYFKPIDDAEVKTIVQFPNGEKKELKLPIETAGVYSIPFQSDQMGKHSVEAWVFRKGEKYGHDKTDFKVIEGQAEEEDLTPHISLMKDLSQMTNGSYVKASDFTLSMIESMNENMAKKYGQRILLWTSPWFLLIMILLFALEWLLRKRQGLP